MSGSNGKRHRRQLPGKNKPLPQCRTSIKPTLDQRLVYMLGMWPRYGDGGGKNYGEVPDSLKPVQPYFTKEAIRREQRTDTVGLSTVVSRI